MMVHITIRLQAEDKSLIDRAVRNSGYTLQDWASRLMLDAAGKDLIDPNLRSSILWEIARDIAFIKAYSELGATRFAEKNRRELYSKAEKRAAQLFKKDSEPTSKTQEVL